MLTPTRPHSVAYPLPGETLSDGLRRAAQDHPGAMAVVEGGTRLTYAELLELSGRFATALRSAGVETGDAVVTQLPNWWETLVVSWGVLLADAVLVPVVPIYRRHELSFILDQVQPRAVVAPGEFRGRRPAAELSGVLDEIGGRAGVWTVRDAGRDGRSLEQSIAEGVAARAEAPMSDPGDVAVVLYTSGTTAQPKGALHSHQTLLSEVGAVASWCRLDHRDRVFMASPLSHITGLSYAVLMPAFLSCGVVLQDRWDAQEAAELIESHHCTFTVSATPFLRGLADVYSHRGRSNLGTFVCGGADIPADLVRRAHRVMGTRVVRTYGSTELPTSSMADPFGDLDLAASGEGPAMGANEMRLHPDAAGTAELLVRGPELFVGYLDAGLNRAAFTDDGYFRTGDQASIDADGTLHITGRIKDIINRGGEKFSVAEIESVLLGHPSVQDVAVVGYLDPVLGERACAVVVPAPDAHPSLEALRDHVVSNGLAIQKAPERLVIESELPRTASGKVQRFLLRDHVRTLQDAPSEAAGSPDRPRRR